jgi:hypothetical protein
MPATTPTNGLIHHPIFIKTRSAAIDVFLGNGSAEIRTVQQAIEVILKYH